MGSPAAGFVAFDLETTGLSPKSDRVIEIGAVRLGPDLRMLDRLQILVDPGMPIPLAVQRLTGLGDRDVEGAASPQEAMAEFADFCEGARLVAHGGIFDMAFCVALLPQAFQNRAVFDTLDLARILLPVAPSHSLPLLSVQLDIEHDRPHRALSDAETTAQLFRALLDAAERLPAPLLTQMRQVAAEAQGPLHDFFAKVVTASLPPPPAAAPLPAALAAPGANGHVPAAGLPLDESVAALLGPDGPLAATLPGYEYREAQVEMARAVAQSLDRGGRLMVEAGTGVGKSLAYLLPLALHAQRTGKRAVVATHTVTLQEQLAHKDAQALGGLLSSPPETAMLKGRQHYISLRRWERFLATPSRGPHGAVDLDVVRFKLKLLCWLDQTAAGDRSELRLAGPDEQLWQRVQSQAEDCLGSACANWRDARCFMVAARRAAARADLVITNHALLLADAETDGQVLGRYANLVVDEAHHLEESATNQLGATLRAADVLATLDRLGAPHPGESALDEALAQAREATQRIFGDVKGFLIDRFGSDGAANGTLGLRDEVREQPAYQSTLVRSAWHALRTWRAAAAALVDARGTRPFQDALFPQPDRLDDELALAAQALLDAAGVVERVIVAPQPDRVAWLELRAEQSELHEAPVDVSEQLRRSVFDRVDAAVLTSATLSVGGSFDYVRSRTGIGSAAHELALESPFEFLRQALTVLPAGMPPYDEEGYEQALADLCAEIAVKLRGRTLVLFTGYSPLKRVHGLLQSRMANVGIAVLGQGLDGTRRQVLASFLANPHTVLLGTNTFWEGIDIQGDALSCVVIAKLPFPVPTDPLVQARAQRVGDPFSQLALPEAVLRLKQGFGRLIRHSRDRGAVVLCDSRLASREYGRAFLQALPQAAVARVPVGEVGRTVEDFVHRGVAPPPPQELMPTMAAASAWEDEPA
jgi:predicted DnaQ family exonuclease/DinG family helicase